jgi:hypothetical protein
MDNWIKAGVIANFLCFGTAIFAYVFPHNQSTSGVTAVSYLPPTLLAVSALLFFACILAYKDKWPFNQSRLQAGKDPAMSPPPASLPSLRLPLNPRQAAFSGVPSSLPPKPKLIFRRKDAVVGISIGPHDNPIGNFLSGELYIAFHFRLVNQEAPPISIRQWSVEFSDSEQHRGVCNSVPVRDDIEFERQLPPSVLTKKKRESFDKDLGPQVSKILMDVNAPFEGWLAFKITGICMFNIASLKFTFTATDDCGHGHQHTEKPGWWLSPVTFFLKESQPS